MKKIKNSAAITTAVAGLFASPLAEADPGVMLGLAINFGGANSATVGVTAKVLTSNKEHQAVGAVGVSYFFENGGYFGLDAGVGYNFRNSAVILGYDFINDKPQVSAGWVNTRNDSHKVSRVC